MKQALITEFQSLRKKHRENDAIRYRLYRISDEKGRDCYQMQCTFRNEDVTCSINAQDIDHAQAIYSKIVQGRVTPCTILEVLEDLCG